MVYIYILELETSKYYIGKTTNPKFRLDQHFNSSGSLWTQKYKPVKVSKLIPDCDDYDEDKYTIKYMEKYGINNVRGGSFCELQLSNDNLITIKKMINNSKDKCFGCGKNGHFIKDCPKDNTSLNSINSLFNNIVFDKTDVNNTTCFRCLRTGHYASNCYAKTTINGDIIEETDISSDEELEIFCCSYCNKEFETLNGCTYHEKFYCKNKYNKKSDSKQQIKCYRCDRNGHYASNCYAKSNLNGKYLG